jgi:DNA-binding GntR family transcriptional regulator
MLDRNSPFLRTADPKRRDSLADLAFRGLRDAIIGCDPAPGAIVTEAGLAERFAYGLAATRAALARLSARGWIAAEPRRGWRVVPLSGAHLADLLRARDLLEPALGNIAIPSAVARDVAVQAEVHHAAVVAGLDAAALTRQELRVHLALAQAVPEARVRGWLAETWQFSARAELCFAACLDLPPPAADLRPLAQAAEAGHWAALRETLAARRAGFAARCRDACARSDLPLLHASPQTGDDRRDRTDQPGTQPDGPSVAGPIPTEDPQP